MNASQNCYAEKKPDKKTTYCIFHFYKMLENVNLSRVIGSRSVREEGGVLRMGGRGCKLYKETFGGDGHVHYLQCGDGFTGVYINQNLPNCSL